jgi:O-antigen ligase
MKKLNKLIEWVLYLFIFLLPWQTRLIVKEGFLNGGHWEWGTISFYALDFVFLFLFLLFCSKVIFKRKEEKCHLPHKIFFLIVLFLVFSLIGVLMAENKEIAFYCWLRLLEGAAFFVFIQKIDFSIVKAGWSFVFSGLIQIGLAIHQLITQHVFSSKWLGMAAQDSSQLGTSVVESAEGRMLRLYGSFSHPNIFAGFLIFLIFILFILYFSNKKSWQRIIILFTASMATITLYFTYSRAAWIVLVLSSIFLMILILKRAPQNFRNPFFEFFGLILVIFIMFSGLSIRDFITRAGGSGRLEVMSTQERVVNFGRAEEVIKENFILGSGLGNYTQKVFDKYPNLNSWEYQPVANIYLLILAELGFIGLILFLVIASFNFLRLGFTIYSPLLLSLLALGFLDHWIFSLSFGILLFWFALALVWKRCLIHELTGSEKIF